MKPNSKLSTKYKFRPAAVLTVVLLLLSAGTIGLQASQTCQRIVKRYVEVPVHHTKATLARWAAWGKEHPNYHPPKRRPKMTKKEVLDKVAFDCQVPVEHPELSLIQVEPDGDLLPVEEATIGTLDMPFRDLLPTDLGLLPTQGGTLPVPVLTPTPNTDVPEPSSWMLALTGVLGLLVVGLRRKSATQGIAAASRS